MILCVYVCVSGWCRRFYLSPDVNRSGPSSPRMCAGVGCVFWNVLMLCLSGRITTRGSISIQVEKQACRSQDTASLLPFVAQRQSSKQKRQAHVQLDILFSPVTAANISSLSSLGVDSSPKRFQTQPMLSVLPL